MQRRSQRLRGWPINFAHRGGAKVVPENTVEGFREGFTLGGGHRSGIELAVFGQIEAAGALKRTLVVSDSRGTISRFRKVSQGKVATASSTVELLRYWILHVLHLGGVYDPPFQALQPPEKYKGVVPVVTRRFVRNAQDRGLRVDVWTIDDEPAMRRLLSYGVDGIMTDRPDVLVAC